MVIDGGLISVPLAAALATLVATTAGGVATGCYLSTGSLTCQGDGALGLGTCGLNATDRVGARWAVVDTTNTDSRVTVITGIERSHEWEKSVDSITSSAWSAFTLDLLGGVAWVLGGGGVGPDGPHPRSMTNRYATTYELLREEQDSIEIECPPGAVWQWVLRVERCAEPEAVEVGTRHLRCSPNRATPPCCVPGYDAEPTDPAAGCLTHLADDGAEQSMRLGGEYCAAVARDVPSKAALRTEEPPAAQRRAARSDARARTPLLGGVGGLALGLLLAPVVARRMGRAPTGPALV